MFCKGIFRIIVLLFVTTVFAQQEASVWYFGIKAGLKFNVDGSVTPLNGGKINTREGCASIATSTGDLLFYTDGRTVWDKNHIVMPNADYSKGTGLFGDNSSTQSAIIVPKPGSSNLFYVFTVDEPHHENSKVYPNAFVGKYASENGKVPDDDDGLNNGLNYSVVDMNIIGTNGSAGDVISRNHHLITYDPNPSGQEIKFKCSEKITAVRDQSNTAFWVITHFLDKFYAFKVTASGVSTVPVISQVAPNITYDGYRYNAIGYLKASPDGTKLAIAHRNNATTDDPSDTNTGGAYLYDFNAATGVVSNGKPILTNVSAYGIEFSPNSNLLYVSYNQIEDTSGSFGTFKVSQFNLLSPDITASNTTLFTSGQYGMAALQLAPNGKIYYSGYLFNSLPVINQPNEVGLACSFDEIGQPLNGDGQRVLGLPPFITSFFDAFFSVKNVCLGTLSTFTLTSKETILSALWNFGDGSTSNDSNPNHLYSSPGKYKVVVTVVSDKGTVTKTKEIIIYDTPKATQPKDILICDDTNDGFYTFDLTQQSSFILNGQDPNLFGVNYYQNDVLITNPKAYINAVAYGEETIQAEVFNLENQECKSITSFKIKVYEQPRPAISSSIPKLASCDNTTVGSDTDGRVLFDLTQNANVILNGQSATQFVLSYYKDAALTQSIISPASYQNTTTSETIYVKVVNKDNSSCFATTSFAIEVLALPVIANVVDLKQCDDNTDGFSVFNLEEAIAKITTNAANETLYFYQTLTDAQNNTNPISNATTYTNKVVSNDAVYVRVVNAKGCFRIAIINLSVTTTQIPLNYSKTFTVCDDALLGTNSDGIASFNFSNVTSEIQNIFPTGQLLTIRYFRNLADALAEKNAIADISNYRNIGYPTTQNIFIRVDSQVNNDCLGLGSHITLNVERVPIVQSLTLNHFDDDQDGKFAFDTSTLQSQLLNGLTNVSVAYFDQNNLPLSSPLPNPFVTSSQKIKVVVTNTTTTACSYESSVDFVVDDLPEAFAVPVNLTSICDDEVDPKLQDGKFAFDTSSFQKTILGSQTGMLVYYFDGSNNPLPCPLPNPFLTPTQQVRVEVVNPINPSCKATVLIPFVVHPIPVVQLTGEELVCSDLPTFTKVIDAGLLDSGQKNNFSYSWTKDGQPIVNATNYELTVNQKGVYSVTSTNTLGCARTRTIIVNASDKAKITVEVKDLSSENTITVVATGAGDYVYALDQEFGEYQKSNTFDNVASGIHTVYVKDVNGCGITTQEVAILGIPKYFTPNQDGYNDTWNVKGVNAFFNSKTSIQVFDRYGKLVQQIDPKGEGWDGNYMGQPLPSDDYWYVIQLEDGRVFKGHFALKR